MTTRDVTMTTLQAFDLRPQPEWRGGNVHKDDILTTAYCPPNLLATASFDGEIIVWSTGKAVKLAPSQSYYNVF